MLRLGPGELEPGMVLAQDVFTGLDTATAFLRTGVKLTKRSIEQLSELRVEMVFVEDGRPATKADILLPQARNCVAPAPPALSQELRQEALSTLQNMFDSSGTIEGGGLLNPKTALQLESVVDQVVESIDSQHGALVNISDLKSYDDYTYHHSLSVAVLSIGLAKQMGFDDLDLRQLGFAAIMHDIGKTKVPVELIRKPARLTNEEFTQVKYHSKAGWEYLTDSSIGNDAVWLGVLHHHEKMDGTGYPYGLKGEEIPLWSRIISVADVYDALTSQRPYRTPMQPGEAIEYIMGGVGTSFDFDVVSAMLTNVSPYPAGSIIELSNGQYALVLDDENQMRPVVEILGTGQVLDLYNDRATYSLVVNRLVPPDEKL